VGNGKTVTLTGATLGGDDAGNYTLSSVNTTTANITQLGITGSFTADNKVYNGTTAETVLTRTLNGVLSPGGIPDNVSLTGGTATFDNRNARTGKTVTLTDASLTGTDSGNYSLTSVSTTTANITAKPLTITGLSAQNKVYDGNKDATINGTPQLDGVVVIDNVADDVSLTGTAKGTFNDALVGNNKGVTVSGLSLTGAHSGNYSLTPLVLHADILSWTLSNYKAPVDMGMKNNAKAGSTVLAGPTELTNTSVVQTFTQKTPCDATSGDDIEQYARGSTSLRYSGTAGVDGQFVFNWQTPKQAAATR
jgi:hypothetical protein